MNQQYIQIRRKIRRADDATYRYGAYIIDGDGDRDEANMKFAYPNKKRGGSSRREEVNLDFICFFKVFFDDIYRHHG